MDDLNLLGETDKATYGIDGPNPINELLSKDPRIYVAKREMNLSSIGDAKDDLIGVQRYYLSPRIRADSVESLNALMGSLYSHIGRALPRSETDMEEFKVENGRMEFGKIRCKQPMLGVVTTYTVKDPLMDFLAKQEREAEALQTKIGERLGMQWLVRWLQQSSELSKLADGKWTQEKDLSLMNLLKFYPNRKLAEIGDMGIDLEELKRYSGLSGMDVGKVRSEIERRTKDIPKSYLDTPY